MRRRRIWTAAAAGMALLLLAGCTPTPEQEKAAEQLCREYPVRCAQLADQLAEWASDELSRVKPQPVPMSAVPEELRRWAGAQADATEPASRSVSTEEGIYVAIAGGLRGSAGYRIDIGSVIPQEDGSWLIEARVIPPDGPAAAVMTNPVGFFLLPGVEGDVIVRFVESGPAEEWVTPQPVPYPEVPEALQAWARFVRTREEALVNTHQTPEGLFVAIAGGLKPTGGYQVKVIGDAVKRDGVWHLDVRVVPPTGMVTQAFTNPVGFFFLPGAEGPVEVRIAGSVLPVIDETLKVKVEWIEGNILHVEGRAGFPDLHFEARVDGESVARADAQIKDGRYIANLIIDGGPRALELEISAVEGDGYILLQRLPVTE